MSEPTDLAHTSAKLERRLGGEELAALRQRMRRHFARGNEDAQSGVLHLSRLTAAEYEAIALLLGLPSRATKSLRIEISDLDAALGRAGIAGSLRQALEIIDGPLVHRATQRAVNEARWAAVLDGSRRHTKLASWLATASAAGIIKRLSRQSADAAAPLLDSADVVMRRLPARGATRAQLAAETLGSAHALDAGQPVATVVLAVLRHDTNQGIPEPDGPSSADEIEKPTERARDTWALAGVLVNELARPALFMNLPALPLPPGLWGEPDHLSLRRLLRSKTAWAVAGRDVYVCENPDIVAIAADRWGAACAPLVCTDGMPAAAQRVLLTQLASAGAVLRYHGDFDWPGIQIANYVMRSFGALPWRFSSGDYIDAARTMRKARDLEEPGIPASWDDSLAGHMRHHGVAIDEEAVATSLLRDLGTDAPSHPDSALLRNPRS